MDDVSTLSYTEAQDGLSDRSYTTTDEQLITEPHNQFARSVFLLTNTLMCVWIIGSNGLLFITLLKQPTIFTKVDCLFVKSMAITDVMTGIYYIITVWMSHIDIRYIHMAWFCSSRALMILCFVSASFLQLALLNFVKLIYIKYPLKYTSYINYKTLTVMSICLALLCFSIMLTFLDAPIHFWVYHCFTTYKMMFSTFTYGYVNITTSILVVSGLQYYLMRVSEQHIKRISATNPDEARWMKMDAKARKAFTSITIVMICLYMPNVIAYYVITLGGLPIRGIVLTFWKTATGLVMVASTINVIIHTYQNKQLRRSMLRLLTCNKFRMNFVTDVSTSS